MHVLDDFDIRDGDQPFIHHLIESADELLDFFIGVHDGDHDRSVGRERNQMWEMDQGTGSVAFDASVHSRARDVQFPAVLNDCPVKRFALPLGIFSKMNILALPSSFTGVPPACCRCPCSRVCTC
jgi:hypothetical protein